VGRVPITEGMLPIVALFVFTAWTVISMFMLALCVAAGRADRALEHIMSAGETPAQAVVAEPDFVLGFAEAQAEIAAPKPRFHVR
jgi:hypothetical protein